MIYLSGEDFIVPGSHGYARGELRDIGARYSRPRDAWIIPATRMNAKALNDIGLQEDALTVDLSVPEVVSDERLYPYQRAAADRLVAAPRGLLACLSPGLGKTVVAIAAADVVVPVGEQIVVVAPASLTRTWEREITRWATVPGEIYVMQGKLDHDAATKARWIICSWDKAVREAKSFGRGWPLWIFDESVLGKSRSSKRFKTLSAVRRGIDRVWLLSGSPVTRYADDLWTQLNLIWPRAYSSYWRFAERYCVVEETPWARVVSGTRRNRDAAADNDDLVLVVNQRDVLELPEYLFEPAVEVALTGAQAKAYRDMARDFIAELKDGSEVIAANEIGRLMQLQRITSYWDGQSAKRDALLDVIGGYDGPYLIWTHWRETAADLERALTDHGLNAVAVTGETADRDAKIEAYKAGDLDALVLSLGVGKFGHTLVNTKTVFYVDKSWNADDYFQSLHRVRRIGLTHRPVIVPIRAAGTVDSLVEDNLEGKLTGISRMTHGDLADLLKGLGR